MIDLDLENSKYWVGPIYNHIFNNYISFSLRKGLSMFSTADFEFELGSFNVACNGFIDSANRKEKLVLLNLAWSRLKS